MKERLDQLRATIDHHNHLYYVMGQPEIPDSRYDLMFRTLLDLEAQYPEFYDPNSPSSRVGSDLRNDFPTITHLSPMLSINAVETVAEIEEFIKAGDAICQLKYDGVGVNLIYKKGKLYRAVTRGDGFKGTDVTTNIRTIRDIPYTVNTAETIEVRGEVWCSYSEMRRLQSLGENVKSPVAIAINTIKVARSATCAHRNLSFTAFHVVRADLRVCPTHTDNLRWLEANNFKTPELFKIKDVLAGCVNTPDHPVKFNKDIAADGIVFKHNDLVYCEAEGFNSRNVNWAISFKFDKEIFGATIAAVGAKIGANGRVTPIVYIDPLLINNEVISKVPVTAADLDTGISVGQTVSIRRKGTRVAQLVIAIRQPTEKQSPRVHYCPQCGTPLLRLKSLLFCPANCQNTDQSPANEKYESNMIYEFDDLPPDYAMTQYIVRQFNCRLMPVTETPKEGRLYFNAPKQLADIGYAVGKYARKFSDLERARHSINL